MGTVQFTAAAPAATKPSTIASGPYATPDKARATSRQDRRPLSAGAIRHGGANVRVYVAVHPNEIPRAETTLAQAKNSVDQRLRAEHYREGETLGVARVGFGGVNHNAQIVGGDDERVAVQRDGPDVRMIDDLAAPKILMRLENA